MLLTIHFTEIAEKHIVGDWLVSYKNITRRLDAEFLTTAKLHKFNPDGEYIAVNGITSKGKWAIVRDEAVQRPYIEFQINNTSYKGLITRLQSNNDHSIAQLDIYLASGVELVLSRRQEVMKATE
jgi:ribulose bisphosphate carboxylase small subunit